MNLYDTKFNLYNIPQSVMVGVGALSVGSHCLLSHAWPARWYSGYQQILCSHLFSKSTSILHQRAIFPVSTITPHAWCHSTCPVFHPLQDAGPGPYDSSRVERIDPLHLLARCRKRPLNQALSVLCRILGFFELFTRNTLIMLHYFVFASVLTQD